MTTQLPLLSMVSQEQIQPRAPLAWAHDLHSGITALGAKVLKVQPGLMIWLRQN